MQLRTPGGLLRSCGRVGELEVVVETARQRSSPDEGPSTGSGRTITVCQVLHSLHVGGAENLAARLALRLGDRFRFVFACLDDVGPLGQQLTEAGIPIEMLQRRPGIDLRLRPPPGGGACESTASTWSMRTSIRRFSMRWPPAGSGDVPLCCGPNTAGPCPTIPRRKRIWFNRALLRGKDRAIGVGRAVAQALIDNEGIPRRASG